jgi:flagellar basal body-associated protein FliL
MRNIITIVFLLFISVPCLAEEDENITYENAYYEISPDIVSNLQGQAKYIRTSIQLMTNRADMLYEIEAHAPLIRHVFLMTLIDKKGEAIKSPQGKEALRKELLEAASRALDEKIETKGLLTDLFFTTYYVK